MSDEQYPERMGMRWSKQEVEALYKEVEEGKSLDDISKTHKRSERGIVCQLKKMATECHSKGISIEKFRKVTGLTDVDLLIKEKRASTVGVENTVTSPEQEMVNLLKEINRKLGILIEKF